MDGHGMAMCELAQVRHGRAESGIYYSVANAFISPDGLHACVCELEGTPVCHRTGADAGPTNVAAMATHREQADGTD